MVVTVAALGSSSICTDPVVSVGVDGVGKCI